MGKINLKLTTLYYLMLFFKLHNYSKFVCILSLNT